MTLPLKIQDYNDFMVWFKENYPSLYHQYGNNITISDEGVSIKGDNITAKDFELIMQIQYEYYQNLGVTPIAQDRLYWECLKPYLCLTYTQKKRLNLKPLNKSRGNNYLKFYRQLIPIKSIK